MHTRELAHTGLSQKTVRHLKNIFENGSWMPSEDHCPCFPSMALFQVRCVHCGPLTDAICPDFAGISSSALQNSRRALAAMRLSSESEQRGSNTIIAARKENWKSNSG